MNIIKEKGYYIIVEKKSGNGGTKKILWVFFLIVFFILVLFPFFGQNLRYSVGNKFSRTFSLIGIVSVTLGAIIIVWGFIMLLCMRSFKAISIMLFGVVLLYFGSFFLNPGTFGLITHGEEVPRGYN